MKLDSLNNFVDQVAILNEVCEGLSKIKESLFGTPDTGRLSAFKRQHQSQFIHCFDDLLDFANFMKEAVEGDDFDCGDGDVDSDEVSYFLIRINSLVNMICRLPDADRHALRDVLKSFDDLLGALIPLKRYLRDIENFPRAD